MRDKRDEAIGGEDGGDAAEEEEGVGSIAVGVVGDFAAGGDEFVRGGEFGEAALLVECAQAGDALGGSFTGRARGEGGGVRERLGPGGG